MTNKIDCSCVVDRFGYRISDEAQKLLDADFEGNGCGSGRISRFLCSVLQYFIGDDLSVCWLVHDAEYSIDLELKSPEHQQHSDLNLHFNLMIAMKLDPFEKFYTKTIKHRFANWIHAALVLKGQSAYWNKPKEN